MEQGDEFDAGGRAASSHHCGIGFLISDVRAKQVFGGRSHESANADPYLKSARFDGASVKLRISQDA